MKKDSKVVGGILDDVIDTIHDIIPGHDSDEEGGDETEEMSIKDKVIDALHIPDAETIKEALKLPSKDDIIQHMFESVPTDLGSDYLVTPLRLDDCAERLASQVSALSGKKDEIRS